MLKAQRPYHTHFKPTRISGCFAWYDAGQGITLAGTGVSEWADQSGNGNTLTQATDSNRPGYNTSSTLIPGRPSLTFNGSSDRINNLTMTQATGDDTPISMFSVASSTTVSGNHSIASWTHGTDSDPRYSQELSNTTFRMQRTDTANSASAAVSATGLTVVVDTPYILGASFAGTTCTFFASGAFGNVNGAQNVGSLSIQRFSVGNRHQSSPNQFWSGDIWEVIMYNRALTTRERKLVERYLARKYRLKCSTF